MCVGKQQRCLSQRTTLPKVDIVQSSQGSFVLKIEFPFQLLMGRAGIGDVADVKAKADKFMK